MSHSQAAARASPLPGAMKTCLLEHFKIAFLQNVRFLKE